MLSQTTACGCRGMAEFVTAPTLTCWVASSCIEIKDRTHNTRTSRTILKKIKKSAFLTPNTVSHTSMSVHRTLTLYPGQHKLSKNAIVLRADAAAT